MKNSPPAVAGGLFFCVAGWGVSRPLAASALFVSDGDNFAPAGAGWGVSCPRHEYLSFFVKRKVPKKTT